MSSRLALLAGGEQSDLLVVADGPGGRPGALGEIADPEGLLAHAATRSSPTSVAGSRTLTSLGRSRETPAPISEEIASTQSAVCMLWMNGASCRLVRPLARP